jgi:hypothetical protein
MDVRFIAAHAVSPYSFMQAVVFAELEKNSMEGLDYFAPVLSPLSSSRSGDLN